MCGIVGYVGPRPCVDLIVGGAYTEATYYMGLVDGQNRPNFYDGLVRVVDPDGAEFLKYPANAFRDMPVRLPASVEWMRFSLSLDENGGGYARLDAKDKDAETAAKNAPDLTEVINKAVVFDYDGTLCSSQSKDGPPPSSVVEHLVRLARAGQNER